MERRDRPRVPVSRFRGEPIGLRANRAHGLALRRRAASTVARIAMMTEAANVRNQRPSAAEQIRGRRTFIGVLVGVSAMALLRSLRYSERGGQRSDRSTLALPTRLTRPLLFSQSYGQECRALDVDWCWRTCPALLLLVRVAPSPDEACVFRSLNFCSLGSPHRTSTRARSNSRQ